MRNKQSRREDGTTLLGKGAGLGDCSGDGYARSGKLGLFKWEMKCKVGKNDARTNAQPPKSQFTKIVNLPKSHYKHKLFRRL
jgi:hypothetical protein